MSHGSLTDAVNASGHVRCTAPWIVSTPGGQVLHAHGHVADELVITCSPAARSYQALWRMPWWPGCAPVMIVVWLASVTVGSDAIAPVPERGAHLDQAGDVRRLAARGHVVEHVGVGAVEQEPDDVARALVAGVEELGERTRRPGPAR